MNRSKRKQRSKLLKRAFKCQLPHLPRLSQVKESMQPSIGVTPWKLLQSTWYTLAKSVATGISVQDMCTLAEETK